MRGPICPTPSGTPPLLNDIATKSDQAAMPTLAAAGVPFDSPLYHLLKLPLRTALSRISVFLLLAASPVSAEVTGECVGADCASERRQAAFERVYADKRWMRGGDGALCSSGWSNVGRGQGVAAAKTLADVVCRFNIASLIDMPIGDLCFSSNALAMLKLAASSEVAYTGIDIVPALVSEANARLGAQSVQFFQADAANIDALPAQAQLIFSRQMTQHMCNADVLRVLQLISRSGARFALLTTFDTNRQAQFENDDIPCYSGGFRAQDLTRPPFSLPPPREFWSEQYPSDGRVGLGLWELPFASINASAPVGAAHHGRRRALSLNQMW